MHTEFIELLNNQEDWLMGQILKYARQRNYTKYTSTLKEAWRLSISGLSKSLGEALVQRGDDFELGPDEDYTQDPATQFGIEEARLHRERGIRLDMFLGLLKYYRQSYNDLLDDSPFEKLEIKKYQHILKRFFDRVEIGFCTAWSAIKKDPLINELQIKNRDMTNEKNKYLTIFESLSMPVLIVDKEGIIENFNHFASGMFKTQAVPGDKYYNKANEDILLMDAFPWLFEIYKNFINNDETELFFEKSTGTPEQYFNVSFSRSLDISGKFAGTIIIIEEITHRKILEKELESLATTDPLTGARNRRSFLNLFEQELNRSERYGYDISVLLMDIDYFKKINDTHGHDTGDTVLKLMVSKSQSLLRNFDIFGRWGGEEFIIFFPQTGILQASAIAERLRDNLSKVQVSAPDNTDIDITVSIGLSGVQNNHYLVEDIVKAADKALYMAKKQGRDRIVVL